jgi:hypothetical protein
MEPSRSRSGALEWLRTPIRYEATVGGRRVAIQVRPVTQWLLLNLPLVLLAGGIALTVVQHDGRGPGATLWSELGTWMAVLGLAFSIEGRVGRARLRLGEGGATRWRRALDGGLLVVGLATIVAGFEVWPEWADVLVQLGVAVVVAAFLDTVVVAVVRGVAHWFGQATQVVAIHGTRVDLAESPHDETETDDDLGLVRRLLTGLVTVNVQRRPDAP